MFKHINILNLKAGWKQHHQMFYFCSVEQLKEKSRRLCGGSLAYIHLCDVVWAYKPLKESI